MDIKMGTNITPGEWKVLEASHNSKNCFWLEISADGENIIAEAKGIHYGISNKECVANANLIAVAPQLLSFIESTLEDYKNHCITLDYEKAAEQLIAKAKGL